jgi:hypothetical protein
MAWCPIVITANEAAVMRIAKAATAERFIGFLQVLRKYRNAEAVTLRKGGLLSILHSVENIDQTHDIVSLRR